MKLLKHPATKFVAAGVVLVAVVLIGRAVFGPSDPEHLTVTAFRNDLALGTVESATLQRNVHTVVGSLTDGRRYSVQYPDSSERSITDAMVKAHVDYKTETAHPNAFLDLLGQVLPIVLMFAMMFWFLRRLTSSRIGGIGKSRSGALTKERPDVTFADVAGCDEAVEELAEIRDFLADPERFRSLGAKIPKGVLLAGPPGSGKTLLARAVAGEAGVPFFSLSGSEFVEMFVGVGAARVRDLFAQAKAAAPAIVFVDEIDAVGRHRGVGHGGGHDEREQTLNQLLVEMDGFAPSLGVILIAATNRPDVLDAALLRPGRFDRQIFVDRPDRAGRRAILEVHAVGKPLDPGVDLDIVARRTPGFTGADLANVLNEAALLTARKSLASIGMPQIEAAVDRVMAGPERRTRLIIEQERQVIAYHESGHALVAHVLPHADPVHKVSIIPRGRALGYTLTLPTDDRFLVRRSELVDELAMLLGGRAAEQLVFDDPTTGAQDDIARATAIARQMVTEYGMSERLGTVRLVDRSGDSLPGNAVSVAHSDDIAAAIDAEVRAVVDAALATAHRIVSTHRLVLDTLAAALLEHETLDVDAVNTILAAAPVESRTVDVAGGSPVPSTTVGTGAAAAIEVQHRDRRNQP